MKSTKVVTSVIYNYLNFGFTTVTGFVFTAVIAHHLSHDRYGILILTGSILSYATLLDLGIGITVMKMIAERAGNARQTEIPAIVRSAVTVFSVIGLAVVVVALCAEPFLGELFHVSGQDLPIFRISLAIAAISVGLTFPSAIYTAIHQAYQDYRYLSILGIVLQAIDIGVGTIMLLTGLGVIALISLGGLLNVAAFIIKARHSHVKFGTVHRRGKASWHFVRQIFGTSVWIFMLRIATYAIFNTDLLVVGAILGTAAVASYQVALGPAGGIQAIGEQFNFVSLTAAASLWAENARAELRRLLLEATRVVSAVAMPAVVVFALWGRQLLTLWVGPSYRSSYSTLVVLSLGLLVAALQGTSAQVIIALNKSKVFALVSLVEAGTNLALGIFLARRIGIVGVALATTIPITITTFGIYVPLACRLIGLRFPLLLRRLVLPVGVNGLAYIALRLLGAEQYVFSNLLLLLIVSAGLFTACFSACVLLDRGERATYLGMIRQLSLRGRS